MIDWKLLDPNSPESKALDAVTPPAASPAASPPTELPVAPIQPPADDGIKPWWASRTVIGIIIMMLAPIGNMIGIQITEPDRAILAELVTTAIITGAGIVALVGRLLAAKPLR